MTYRKCLRHPPRLLGYYYDARTIFNARVAGELLCLRLDLTYECNLQCKYCYAECLKKHAKEASFDEIIDTVKQAINLGLRSVVLLGGEPMLFSHLYDFLEFLLERNIIPVMFTNGTLITKKEAERLYLSNVSVIVKFDGFENSQDFLSGAGTFRRIQRGLKNLISVGFKERSEKMLRLGCASVVTKVNYNELPQIWRYFRKNHIFPNVERMTVLTPEMSYLALSDEQAKELTVRLREIDEREFGIEWDSPYSPIPAHTCSIFYVGCHVNPYREVSACPELEPVESLRKKKLREILNGEYFQKTRNIDKYISGKCASCKFLLQAPCYGCRSKASRRTGSLFAEDYDCPV